MFETSIVKERVAAQRRAGVFGASIAAHTVVIAAVILASISSASFPKNAPHETTAWMPVVPITIPPPLGNPNAPRHPQHQAAQPAPQRPQQQTAPPQVVAPNTIPDTVAVQSAATSADSTATGPATSTGEQWGDRNGDPNGIDLGQSSSLPATGVPNVIYQPGADVKPATVLARVQPVYPRAGIAARLPGWVVVKCVISKSGEIRDMEIVKSSMSMFEQPALDALRQWKFAPGYFHGQAVDTFFELRITFEVR